MFKSYFILTWRNLLKNKTSTLINIFGLSIAIGCSLVAYIFVYRANNPEWFHANGDRIFLIDHKINGEEKTKLFDTTPSALGPALTSDFPQIEHVVRIYQGSGNIQTRDEYSSERIHFVDPKFLKTFTFPLKYGNPDALEDPSGIVLGERSAVRFFGKENPIGQSINIRLGDRDQSFTVKAVAYEPWNSRSYARFRILLPFSARPNNNDNWKTLDTNTYVLLRDLADTDLLTTRLNDYVTRHNSATNSHHSVSSFILDHLPRLKLRTDRVNPIPQIVLSALAAFLLALSCFNYVNIAIATANRRIKEIGIRKVSGSHRHQIALQFLLENTLICFLTLLLGLCVAHAFLLPAFNQIAHQNLDLVFAYHGGLWFYLPTLLIALILISGAYPALYISSFQPISIFASRVKFGHGSILTQSLLTFQFILAFITMMVCVGIVTNAKKLKDLDWGYNSKHTLIVETDDHAQFTIMRNAARNIPDILQIAGTWNHIGKDAKPRSIILDGQKSKAQTFAVTPEYFKILGLRLKTGAFPSTSDAIIINETLARRQSLNNPIGQSLDVGGIKYTISGVVKNFHFRDFREPIDPAFLHLGKEDQQRYLILRVQSGSGIRTAQTLSAAWKNAYPNTRFVHYFQDDVFEGMYRETSSIISLFTFVSTLALIISCSGLFGLAAQQLAGRMKEVCIRKVLGASLSSASLLVFRKFLILLFAAALLAIPVSNFALNTLLDDIYNYRADVGTLPFIIAFGLIISTALITVSTHIRQLTNANPAEVLRDQ